ncbi:exonuclease domain-containing protein [Agromyces sp. NPDC057679]|uniref:exonuclease domain-containing protein n=1 Tax=Agromyces sp. NPDC057679 TaxID=3346207 RepID=UPI00366FFAAC
MTTTTDPVLTNLWVDLEATGLDEQPDAILEIGSIGTDQDLNILFEYTAVIRAPRAAINRMRANIFVRRMHQANGLFDEVDSYERWALLPDIAEVEGELIEKIMSFGDAMPGELILSGSGVSHYDNRFLKEHMPALSTLFNTREMLDTGAERRAYKRATGGELTSVNDKKPHRALDDVRLHLEEGRAQLAARRAIAELTVNA